MGRNGWIGGGLQNSWEIYQIYKVEWGYSCLCNKALDGNLHIWRPFIKPFSTFIHTRWVDPEIKLLEPVASLGVKWESKLARWWREHWNASSIPFEDVCNINALTKEWGLYCIYPTHPPAELCCIELYGGSSFSSSVDYLRKERQMEQWTKNRLQMVNSMNKTLMVHMRWHCLYGSHLALLFTHQYCCGKFIALCRCSCSFELHTRDTKTKKRTKETGNAYF